MHALTSLLKKRLLQVPLEKHKLPPSKKITQRSELAFLRMKKPALVKSLHRAFESLASTQFICCWAKATPVKVARHTPASKVQLDQPTLLPIARGVTPHYRVPRFNTTLHFSTLSTVPGVKNIDPRR